LGPLIEVAGRVRADELSRFLPPEDAGRRSAVLVLFGESVHGPDLLLTQRSAGMRSHAGQPAFPGGVVEPEDDGPVDAALREAHEETGLDPGGVEIVAVLPDLYLPPSGYVVTPVIGWWHTPTPVAVRDPGEVAAVVRVPLSELTDARHRVRVRHPSGFVGPGFDVRGLLVWGFTGGLLDRLIYLAGWERPWDTSRIVDLPQVALGTSEPPAEGMEEAP
jgi:8-oxo-dGTP pyrophosphatase MutT (NUDIX family)